MRSGLDVLNLYPSHDHSLAGAFASRLSVRAAQPFVAFEGSTRSWEAIGADAAKVARLFHDLGVRPGDRVGIMSRNHPWHLIALLGLSRLGAIMVPINPDFGIEETRYVVGHADLCGLICSAETGATALAVIAGQDVWSLCIDPSSGDGPSLDARLAGVSTAAPPVVAGLADATCVIVYTSGTTGLPKGVMHSQRSMLMAGEAFVERVRLQETDRAMIVLPLFHMNALFYSLAGAMVAGASMLIMPRFSASRFWSAAFEGGATVVNLIEAAGNILKMRSRDEYEPRHRLRVAYGIRESAAKAFREEFGIAELYSGFGMTEIPGVTCNTRDRPNKPGSMGVLGRHPDPDQPWAECRVVDDQHRDVADGEIGELIVKTPIVMQGYFRDEAQTAAAFRDGWFYTGDMVRRDADGFFFHVARKKDIIRRRGENISGAELDRVIGEHPGVAEVAAIAVPSELGEDEIMAVVVRSATADIDALAIAQWCRERLAPQKVPRFIVFVNALPRTATHKVAKEILRKDIALRNAATDLDVQHPARRQQL